jgi:hypothetical protein
MDTTALLSSVDSEIAILQQVHALLVGNVNHVRRSVGPKRKRIMSPAARARIAAAQKKRWAAWKKANKTSS